MPSATQVPISDSCSQTWDADWVTRGQLDLFVQFHMIIIDKHEDVTAKLHLCSLEKGT
jgi:hypothetical protein